MVSTEGRIKFMNWTSSKPHDRPSGLWFSPDYFFLRSLGCCNLQECWQRIAIDANSVLFLFETIKSGYWYGPPGKSLSRTSQTVQRPIYALYCTCCDWDLPQSAMRVSCRRPSHFITGSSELGHRRHAIPESYQTTKLYKPQQGHFQAHYFTYPLSAGLSVFRCSIDTVTTQAELAWMLLMYENRHLHSRLEFCKLTAISRLDMS
jgi:hypothetical protein